MYWACQQMNWHVNICIGHVNCQHMFRACEQMYWVCVNRTCIGHVIRCVGHVFTGDVFGLLTEVSGVC